MGSLHEPCGEFGRAVLPRRFSIGAAQQRSPTKKGFIVTRSANFRKGATHEFSERCAAFMPLQGDFGGTTLIVLFPCGDPV